MISQDYYYKGGSTLVTKEDNFGNRFVDDEDTDIKKRYVGTKEEINKLHKEFINRNKYLYLDEVYDYKVYKKGEYWFEHHCFGTTKEYKETMDKISKKLKEYKEQYKSKGSFIVQ